MRILGIDPGIGITGWSVVDIASAPTLVAAGVITTVKNSPTPGRLAGLETEFCTLLDTYRPQHVALEKLFFSKNVTTAMRVSQACGVVMMCAHKAGAEIFEYTPMQVKQLITGYGKAAKPQVRQMLAHHLPGATIPTQDDAADAIAVALTHHAARRLVKVAS